MWVLWIDKVNRQSVLQVLRIYDVGGKLLNRIMTVKPVSEERGGRVTGSGS